jgi:hypothetical protein
MTQQDERGRDYAETSDPKNPPNSVLAPAARTATVSTFLGGIIVFFLIVAAALIYWKASNRRIAPDPGDRAGEAAEVGTSFDPSPTPDSTRDEIEYRGGVQGPEVFTDLGTIFDAKPAVAVGRRVDLHDVDVASAEPGRFWIHDGNVRLEVIAGDAATPIRQGQAVDITGTVEADGGTVRIRAERVNGR